MKAKQRKVTVLLPEDLVQRALAASGVGLTPTIRQGLEAVGARAAYEGLLRMQGKVHLNVDVAASRRDR